MRFRLSVFVVLLTLGLYAGHRLLNRTRVAVSDSAQGWTAQAAPSAAVSAKARVAARVDFATQVRPILDPKCQPCHFNGGTMYQRLPFDRPDTIKTLGTKLFTRIKDENERQIIRAFLAQGG